jgi:hypothetical protein
MDSDDEEMRDASSDSVEGGDGDAGYEEAREGLMVMEVRWFEVDLDYEYDAPRWFDLAREEAPLEAAAAEMWFATAPSYPPSRTSPSTHPILASIPTNYMHSLCFHHLGKGRLIRKGGGLLCGSIDRSVLAMC